MQMHKVKRDGQPSLKFRGEQIARTESAHDRAHPDFSGETGRWTRLSLYRTQGGTLVAARADFTLWQGEHDCFSAQVCADEGEVIAFFGQGRLAQALYGEAGLDNVECIP